MPRRLAQLRSDPWEGMLSSEQAIGTAALKVMKLG
jgi:hypothetical protein